MAFLQVCHENYTEVPIFTLNGLLVAVNSDGHKIHSPYSI